MTRAIILALVLSVFLVFSLGTVPVVAAGDCNPDEAGICICDEAEGSDGETGAAEPIRIFFTILSVLGPVFATLFFVGMSVAGAAQMKDEYKDDRRRVLILGFSVPIAISFLQVIGSELVGQRIDCFFP
jgi:hypothetical protein